MSSGPETPRAAPSARLKVLSLSTVFPAPGTPHEGLFVQARLESLAARADVKVLAPVPLVPYARLRSGRRAAPARRVTEADSSLEVLRPRWFYPPFGGTGNAVFLFLRLLPVCVGLRRRFRFAVLDAHFGHPAGVAAALLAGVLRVPFCVTLRGLELDRARKRLPRWALGWSLRRAARVIAVAAPLRELALSLGVEPGRVSVVPNGVDRTVFCPRDRGECRRRHGLAAGDKIVLSAGHLIPLKGHHHAIQAVKRLRMAGLPVRLLIAGGAGAAAGYAQQLRELVRVLELDDAVKFLGEVPPVELAELMAAADVFCLASSREGWPNVVQEALSCGTPVVATAVGGVPQQIPSEDFGLVVPPADERRLAEALRRALERRWDRDGIAAWGASRSWEEVAMEVERELRAAAA